MVELKDWAILLLWAIFYAYWGLAARSVARSQRGEATGSRVLHMVLIVSAFALVFVPWPGVLAYPLLAPSPLLFWVGLAVQALGLGFAVWARVHLGLNWSGSITVKHDHELIRSGPYGIVRHPIYTGIIVGIIGSAVAFGQLRGLIAIILVLAAYLRKIRIEERWLVEQFGPDYTTYQREVKSLIPFVL